MKKTILTFIGLLFVVGLFSDFAHARSDSYVRSDRYPTRSTKKEGTTYKAPPKTSPKTPSKTSSDEKQGVEPMAYHVGIGDVLTIEVFGEEEMTSKYTVSEGGAIDFPLLGRVKVGGLTPSQVTNRIRGALASDYLVNPKVQVTVESYGARGKIYVSGAVKTAGAYPYEPGLTVLNAVVLAGGFTELASPARTKLMRRDNSKSKTTTVNLKKILKGKINDIVLQPGDRIFIPESLF